MKFALVKGIKAEASKGAKGTCPSCGSELIAKCGEVIVNHWAHKGIRNCDPWWENETEWHRKWKNNFPIEWQEIVQFSKTGEKHIADVKTEKGWVLEFQHSYLKPEERHSRNAFYSKIVWVIDGLRRKTDKIQFQKILEESSKAPVGGVNIRQVNFPENSRLLLEWLNCGVPVFFDFYELYKSTLWFLLPLNIKDKAYLIAFSREEFINVHNNNGFDELVYNLIPKIQGFIRKYERNRNQIRFVNPSRRRYRRRF
ncbi:competence protein CoiA [Membranihabitans maritimus]|uniref:competence protein CoiA n=1 Tax=Membranihabitans maritimus TaxID=2904244 RepID=UPI001F2614F7|nr:competence protein CoiA family protein [Membranihabitans maritimus]